MAFVFWKTTLRGYLEYVYFIAQKIAAWIFIVWITNNQSSIPERNIYWPNPVPKIKSGSSNPRMRQSRVLKTVQESSGAQKGKWLSYKVTTARAEVFWVSHYSYWGRQERLQRRECKWNNFFMWLVLFLRDKWDKSGKKFHIMGNFLLV